MTAAFTCPHCSSTEQIPLSADRCPSCQKELTAPNVRAAQSLEEKQGLGKRLSVAEDDASARDCLDVLEKFGDAVGSSEVAICRPLGIIISLVNDPNQLYSTFYNQMDGKQRLPEGNEYDGMRGAIDALFFPHYHQKIVFGALTLDGKGVTGYGGTTMILREEMIGHRASLFDTNTLTFAKKQGLQAAGPVPVGFRAEWMERSKIAKAKLHYKITPTTDPTEYAGILLEKDNSSTEPDFIEVHVYEGFNRAAIGKVVFEKEGVSRTDKFLIRALKKKLEASNIQHEDI